MSGGKYSISNYRENTLPLECLMLWLIKLSYILYYFFLTKKCLNLDDLKFTQPPSDLTDKDITLHHPYTSATHR